MLASLHNHTSADPIDPIQYSDKDLIDHAKKDGFKILAITCHNKTTVTKEAIAYAKEQGLLLIPGVEQTIEHRHIVILNAAKEADTVKTFKSLREYKGKHPECFIFAAHPYFPSPNFFHDKIEPNIDCIDGLELSWWYSKLIDFNKKGRRIAKKHNLPFIGTSDTHSIHLHGKTYCQISATSLTLEAVIEALRKGNFKNFTKPISTWQMAMTPLIVLKDKAWLIKQTLLKLFRGH